MYLLRMLMLNNLLYNRVIKVKYISSKENDLADSLSRLDFKRFWRLAQVMTNEQPTPLSSQLWPMSKIWQD